MRPFRNIPPIVWIVAIAHVALQLAVSGRYGYFRDEFYYLACAEHLAWGHVDHRRSSR